MARRVGDPFAGIIAEINLQTARAARGEAPAEEEMLELVRRALAEGYPDEAYRAVVNYLWAAIPFLPTAQVEASIARAQELMPDTRAIEAYDEYIDVSLGMHVYLPCGRWDELAAMLGRSKVPNVGGTFLAWRAVTGALALARGDLDTMDAFIDDAWAEALASEEPQRILPLAGPALARAAVAGDVETARSRGAVVATMRASPFMPTAVPRALRATGLDDELRRVRDTLRSVRGDRRDLAQLVETVEGLAALGSGETRTAVERLTAAVDISRARGRDYETACLTLDLATALDAAGRSDEAAAMREPAEAFLASLGCVNPF